MAELAGTYEGLIRKTDATAEPLLTADAAKQVEVGGTTAHDAYLDTLVKAARMACEEFCGRALIEQTWTYYLSDWPDGDAIVLPRPRLISVTSVKYTPWDGTATTFAGTNYLVDVKSEPGLVRLKLDKAWPSDELEVVNGVEVEYKAGYGAAGAAVPAPLKQGMLLLIGDWFLHREGSSLDAASKGVRSAVESLWWPYRVFTA